MHITLPSNILTLHLTPSLPTPSPSTLLCSAKRAKLFGPQSGVGRFHGRLDRDAVGRLLRT